MTGLLTELIAYEDGVMTGDEELALFADLVRSGLAWTLQGRYGRQAVFLIRAGYLSEHGEILKNAEEG